MVLNHLYYLLPDDWKLQDLQDALAQSHHFSEGETGLVKQTYLESFDWRLWQAGAELVFEESESANRLCWYEHRTGAQQGCVNLENLPRVPKQIPQGHLRQRVAQVLEMRILLPVVCIEQQLRILRVLNKDEKTVLRLGLYTSRFSSPDGKQTGPLDSRVQLLPVKGYDKHLSRVQTRLESLGLEPVLQSPFTTAVNGIGRRPGDYTSKLNYRLDPDMRTDVTTRQILQSLLQTLEANIDGTKADLDSEFLHDLRVATRRTRSAMTQIKGVFDPQELEPFKNGFAWLGQMTGPTRDLDVYLLKFESYQQSLPEKIQPDLAPFHDFLVAHQQQAHKELVRKINSPHFRKLMKEWHQWLESPLPDISYQPNAMQPIAKVADQRIRKIYHRVLKEGRAIKPDSPAEALHDLRKDCKKLRYLMEFFQSLYPKPEIRRLIKLLKVLLDNLGDFQDLQVQAEALESFAELMLKEGAPASALMAMGILVGNLLTRQEQARDAFAELFADFNAEQNIQAFTQLFGGK